MGFMGRYCQKGDEFLLEQLKTSNLKLLTGSSVGVPSLERDELFPDAYPVDSGEADIMKPGNRFSKFTILGFCIPVGLYIVLLIIYKFILASMVKVI